MSNFSVDLNDIEWITNGERASSINLNRALKQYITKNNVIMDNIESILSGTQGLSVYGGLENINALNNPITAEDLGSYLLRKYNTIIPSGLPIGWNCWIISDNASIELSFDGDNTTTSISANKTVKLVKLSDTRWLIHEV